jgi:hypothetical protein
MKVSTSLEWLKTELADVGMTKRIIFKRKRYKELTALDWLKRKLGKHKSNL